MEFKDGGVFDIVDTVRLLLSRFVLLDIQNKSSTQKEVAAC